MPSTASPTRRRRAVLTAVAAAVLLLIGVPAAASAKTTCDTGEFCLYSNPNLSGGLYQFSGSDSNLWNDDFENEDTVLIAGTNAESAQNRGAAHPSDLIDVAVYPPRPRRPQRLHPPRRRRQPARRLREEPRLVRVGHARGVQQAAVGPGGALARRLTAGTTLRADALRVHRWCARLRHQAGVVLRHQAR